MRKCLFDTSVIINSLRGYKPAVLYLSSFDPTELNISHITYSELIKGVANKKQLNLINKLMSKYCIDWGSSEINKVALSIMQKHYLEDKIGILDSIIAATAIVWEYTLITDNIKHFRNIKGLIIEKPNYNEYVKKS